jgi:hypothetical protein
VSKEHSYGGPAATGILNHVALGGTVGTGDHPDHSGQERQWPLPGGIEESLDLQ